MLIYSDNTIPDLVPQVPVIIAAATKQMGPKCSLKTKSAVFAMLRQLVHVTAGGLQPHMDQLMQSVTAAMGDKSSALKLDGLSFLRLLMEVLLRGVQCAAFVTGTALLLRCSCAAPCCLCLLRARIRRWTGVRGGDDDKFEPTT